MFGLQGNDLHLSSLAAFFYTLISVPLKLELVIRDEDGNILSQLDPYLMDLGSQSLHEIEGAVEDWRQKVLPDIEADLLNKAQSRFTQQAKKQ